MDIQPSPKTGPALPSAFAGDTDMAELVELFVGDLPQRVDALRAAAQDDDFDLLARLAHQLKGAGGGYGYPAITDAGARLEAQAKAFRDATHSDADISQLQEGLVELINLCQRAAA